MVFLKKIYLNGELNDEKDDPEKHLGEECSMQRNQPTGVRKRK